MAPGFPVRPPRPRGAPAPAALLVLALLPCLLAAAPEEDGRRPFQPMDVFELEWAEDPRIAPDGSRVVYERHFMDLMRDRDRSHLWLLSADGSDHRPLTSGVGSDGSPRWSPSRDRIAFVSRGGEDGPQIHLLWLDTGRQAAISRLRESPGSLTWSPDGRSLAFTLHVASEPEPLVDLPKPPEGATWAPPPKVIEEVRYRADGAGYLEPGHRHLFVLSVEGGTPRQLTSGAFDVGGPLAWTPDGEALVFSANRREDRELEPLDSELWRVPAAGGALEQLTDRRGPDTDPVLSPDGGRLAYLGFDDRHQGYQVTGLWVRDLAGGAPRRLAADLDRSLEDPRWSADGRHLWFQYDDEGDTRIGRVPVAGGAVEVMATAVGGTSLGRPYGGGSFTLARDGDAFAYTAGGPGRPSDVAAGRPGTEPRRLTELNEDLFATVELGAVEELWATSTADGRPIHAWLVRPPGFEPGERYPLILEIHGGPFANYGPRFAAELQLYAAAGYAVVYANPRGSTSYGEEFGNLIHHAYPGDDYHDLMAVVDAAAARDWVDGDALYVTGGSGGGVLTAWIVGHTDRFRAAVSAKPVIHWTSFVLTADVYPFFTGYWFPGPPWEQHEHYWRRSPLAHVGKVTTPTMLLTGEADHRTPITESEQFYQALKLRGVDTALVRVPEASHGIASRPSHLIAKVAHVLGWFARYAAARDEEHEEDGGETGGEP